MPASAPLDPGHGTGGQEVEELAGGQRPAVGQPQPDRGAAHAVAARAPVAVAANPPAQLGRGEGEDLAERVVELADAAEAGGEGHVGDRQVGRLDQQPGGLRPLGAGQGQRPRPHLGHQQPVELALAVAESGRQAGHALAVDRAVGDEPHGPGHHVGPRVPLRRAGAGVGPAAHAGPEPGLLGRGGARVEADVGRLRRHRRAAGAAVDPGRGDGGDEPAVEAGVPALHGPVAAVEVLQHRTHGDTPRPSCLAGIGHGGRGAPGPRGAQPRARPRAAVRTSARWAAASPQRGRQHPGALHVEVEVALPGVADGPVDLEGDAGGQVGSVGGQGLGHRGVGGAVGERTGQRVGGAVDGGPGELEADPGVGQGVLHRLVAADRPAELVPRRGVGHGHGDQPVGQAEQLGGRGHRRPVDQVAHEGRGVGPLGQQGLGPAGSTPRCPGRAWRRPRAWSSPTLASAATAWSSQAGPGPRWARRNSPARAAPATLGVTTASVGPPSGRPWSRGPDGVGSRPPTVATSSPRASAGSASAASTAACSAFGDRAGRVGEERGGQRRRLARAARAAPAQPASSATPTRSTSRSPRPPWSAGTQRPGAPSSHRTAHRASARPGSPWAWAPVRRRSARARRSPAVHWRSSTERTADAELELLLGEGEAHPEPT